MHRRTRSLSLSFGAPARARAAHTARPTRTDRTTPVARTGLAALALALALTLATAWPARAADPADAAAAQQAATWLATQQQADGGFEVAGFPGFETPDAVLAIAEAAQTGGTWSTAEALAAVQALVAGGATPLDALDDFVDAGGLSAGQAAKLVVLVAAPLGLDPADFDPSDDTADPVDLMAIVDAGALPDGSYGAGVLNATLYAMLAERLAGGAVPAAATTYVRGVQHDDGSWNFAGTASPDGDVDTTALAVQALIAAGASPGDADVQEALAFLAGQHGADGSWSAFGSPDPNSTSVASLALRAAGWDPAEACWRDAARPDLAGNPYTAPASFVRTQQQADGRIASPNDAFGVNTFATSQAIQGLLAGWLPVVRAEAQPCPDPPVDDPDPQDDPTTTTTAPPPSTTAPAPTTTPTTAASPGATVPTTAPPTTAVASSTVSGTLPATGAGSSSWPLTLAGVSALGLGTAVVVAARRRAGARP